MAPGAARRGNPPTYRLPMLCKAPLTIEASYGFGIGGRIGFNIAEFFAYDYTLSPMERFRALVAMQSKGSIQPFKLEKKSPSSEII